MRFDLNSSDSEPWSEDEAPQTEPDGDGGISQGEPDGDGGNSQDEPGGDGGISQPADDAVVSADPDLPEEAALVLNEWQPLSLRCAHSLSPLTDPACGAACPSEPPAGNDNEKTAEEIAGSVTTSIVVARRPGSPVDATT